MSLKKLGLAIMVASLLGAIMASSAFAANTEPTSEGKVWKCTNLTTNCASQGITLKPAKHKLPDGTEPEIVTFRVLAGPGGTTEYHLTATGVSCVSCTITTGTGKATGKIKFTGVTVMKPAGCLVEGGEVETKSITANADQMHEGKAYVKFEPTAGPATAFATVNITECPSATSLVVKGTVWGQALNATGVLAAEQGITLSTPIHETTNSTINVNSKTAQLEGGALAKLASGAAFGIN